MRPASNAARAGALALALAAGWLPAQGQDAPQSILPPGFDQPVAPRAPTAPSAPAAPSTAAPRTAPDQPAAVPPADADGDAVADEADDLADAAAPPEPEAARRPLDQVGMIAVYGSDAFGAADGRYLATLMRRLQTPLASRWAEIALRRLVAGATPAPPGEGAADWVGDRAALLLRLGEANAARVLVAGVDPPNFSPRLRAAAIRSALASADPGALCALPAGPERAGDLPAWPMVRAICATLAGDEATANATIGRAPPGDPVDHALAEKLVAAGGGGRRQVTVEWAAVDQLTDWRFGLATALGVTIPPALLDSAPAWFQAWLAQAPMLATMARLAPARAAAVLGPTSNAELVDLYARAAAEGGDDPDGAPAHLRQAYRGDDEDARLAALHALWDTTATGPAAERERYAAAILSARAAIGILPARNRRDEAVPVLRALFAGGFDRQAQRWAGVVAGLGGADGDRAWAMLATGAEQPGVAITPARVQAFAKRAGDDGRHRTAMLAAALAGLNRLDVAEATRVARTAGFDLQADPALARALNRAVAGGQPGTVILLAAVALQSPRWAGIVPADLFHLLRGLRAAGLDGEARMIAAEAMARL